MAARIVVPESVEKPYEYYRDNVAKSLELFDQLIALGKPRVLFSSSASLYADQATDFEVTEDDALDPPSPYARTKRMMEQILEDMAAATDLRAIILRYFNPIGSDPDLESGIYAKEPSHVLGQLVMAARGQKDAFTITGTDHPTRDGTGIRDYIHVWDLAQAHVRAVEQFDEVLAAAAAPSVDHQRRPRSTASPCASWSPPSSGSSARRCRSARRRRGPVTPWAPSPTSTASRELLGWQTELDLDEAIASALAWGDQAPGDPGLRVSPCGIVGAGRCWPSSRSVSAAARPRARRRPRRACRPSATPSGRAAGRRSRSRAGSSSSTRATSSATTTSRGRSTGWCPRAASRKPCNTTGTATNGGYPGGDLHLARVARLLRARLERARARPSC